MASPRFDPWVFMFKSGILWLLSNEEIVYYFKKWEVVEQKHMIKSSWSWKPDFQWVCSWHSSMHPHTFAQAPADTHFLHRCTKTIRTQCEGQASIFMKGEVLPVSGYSLNENFHSLSLFFFFHTNSKKLADYNFFPFPIWQGQGKI